MENQDLQTGNENADTEDLTQSDVRIIAALRRLPLERRKHGMQECEELLEKPVSEHMAYIRKYVAKQHEFNKARYITHPEESEFLDRFEKNVDRRLSEDPTALIRKCYRRFQISIEE